MDVRSVQTAAAVDGQLLFSEKQAARLLNLCSRSLWAIEKRGDIKAVKIGSRKLYSRPELERFVQRLTEVRSIGGAK